MAAPCLPTFFGDPPSLCLAFARSPIRFLVFPYRSSSTAKPGPAKKRSRPISIATHHGKTAHFSRLIAPPFLESYWNPSCSDLKRGPSLVLVAPKEDYLSSLTPEPCYSTTSPNATCPFRQNCSVSFRTAASRRIGSGDEIHVSSRVICLANVSLEQEVQCGRFREDLFHRIAGISLHMPLVKGTA